VTRILRYLVAIILIITPTAIPTASAVAQERGNSFGISDNVMADVDQLIDRAKRNKTLALVIIGANWCHDTRSLTDNLDDPAMQAALKGYDYTLVNADQFAESVALVKRFQQATLYATPTLLIINPETEGLVNSHDMHQWRDAYKMPLAEKIAYFERMKEPKNHTEPRAFTPYRELNNILSRVWQFERQQAARIEAVYGTLIPLVEDHAEDRPDNFIKQWNELFDLRAQLTDDIARLEKEAKDRFMAGERNFDVTLPSYPKFSWED